MNSEDQDWIKNNFGDPLVEDEGEFTHYEPDILGEQQNV